MYDHNHGTPSGDHTPNTPEHTPAADPLGTGEIARRALYDAVVAVHFQPAPEEVARAKEDPENHWVPDYTPDQAGLTVFRLFGRWFAVWRSLEEKDGPEAIRWTVLRIIPAPAGSPHPYDFLEV
jgi:hypothetical protein